jgi:hypothetical protein
MRTQTWAADPSAHPDAPCAKCGGRQLRGYPHSPGACRAQESKVRTVVHDLALNPVLIQFMSSDDAQLLLDHFEPDVRPRLLNRVARDRMPGTSTP